MLFREMSAATHAEYEVPFSGLKNGNYQFEYKVDEAFFVEKPYSPLRSGNIDLLLDMEKHESFFVLNFNYKGVLGSNCDRCLREIDLPVVGSATLLVKYKGDNVADELSDEVMLIDKNDVAIDFSQYLYENLIVNIPLYKSCEDDASGEKECSEDILKYLEEDNSTTGLDPRWEKLKELKKHKDGTS